ncbi:GNAT family N-acetyltransferase [Paenibacillus sp. MBLB4367]|uniref:GNAT family N-acetyltransferase n=1 Tax=Paenibacillus sp. MBLB4367 TaxID=3384767 RepID=UPI003907FC1D
MITIREAEASDLCWINDQYGRADFLPSTLVNETVVIARWQDQKAGLGRLVRIDADHAELGGIYTLDAFRGKKVAHAIVRHLTEEARKSGDAHVYCIPFGHLRHFYERFGFRLMRDAEEAHEQVKKKYEWCLQQYAEPTLLMKLEQ